MAATAFGSSVLEMWSALVDDAAITITYKRGSTSLSLTAIPGFRATDLAIAALSGQVDSFVRMDFVLRRSDLILGMPERKDEIVWTDDGGTMRTMEVLPIAGERMYDPVDPQSLLLRVHTKEK